MREDRDFLSFECLRGIPSPQNIPDDLIEACAATGRSDRCQRLGRFIGNDDNSTRAWFRHLDHMVQLVGPEHVGLGLDYVWDLEEVKAFYRQRPDLFPAQQGYVRPSSNIEPERLPGLVQAMLEHGYPHSAIRMILGENHLRIAESWRRAG